ncbi:MAG: aldehyde dehydrogenase family protein, partial [Chloroflexota bacterium]
IAFTGSNAVGLGIMARAAVVHPGQRSIKRVIAELGGKNAIVIDEDADLDLAVADSVTSAFGYAGQKCSACSRLVIVGRAYQPALDRLRGAVASLQVGPPHEPQTFVPPVITAAARDRIEGYAAQGERTAAQLVQGRAPDAAGHYVAPRVFTGVPLDAPLARDEIFGPVLSVFQAADFDSALRIAGDSAYGLTGGLFSRHPSHIAQAKRDFLVGNLYINRRVTGAVVGRQAFGGLHMSGEGEKAGGPDYLRQFTVSRTITENTMRRGFAPER